MLPKCSCVVVETNWSNDLLQRQTLECQLSEAQAALTQALGEREKLLLEVRKHDPAFTFWASLLSVCLSPLSQLHHCCCWGTVMGCIGLNVRNQQDSFKSGCWTCLKRRWSQVVALDHFQRLTKEPVWQILKGQLSELTYRYIIPIGYFLIWQFKWILLLYWRQMILVISHPSQCG